MPPHKIGFLMYSIAGGIRHALELTTDHTDNTDGGCSMLDLPICVIRVIRGCICFFVFRLPIRGSV